MQLARILPEADFQFRNLVLSAPSLRAPALIGGGMLDAVRIDAHIADLRRDGMTANSSLVTPNQLTAIRGAIDDAFAGRRPEAAVEDFPDSRNMTGYVREPLLLCDEIVALAFSPDLLNIVSRYLRRQPILADADLRRIYPASMDHLRGINEAVREGISNADWHYDNRGRQVKVMIYLTDVGPDDQNFAFCPGTQRGFKFAHPSRTRFSDDHIANTVTEIREIHAPAGTALIFDTRGIHRLRRKPSRPRDSITFYYHSGATQRFPRRIARRDYDALPRKQQANLIPVG